MKGASGSKEGKDNFLEIGGRPGSPENRLTVQVGNFPEADVWPGWRIASGYAVIQELANGGRLRDA